MKIFNWMHRRFHHNLQKDGFDRNVKKPALSSNDQLDRQALLKQVALVNVFDGWRDAVLTIGTFGLESFEPDPKFINQKHDYLILQSQDEEEEIIKADEDQGETYSVDNVEEDVNREDDNYKYEEYYEEEEEEEEMNPLMFTTFDQDIESEFGANVVKPDLVLNVPFCGCSEIQPELGLTAINQRKKKGERVTLADLFSADSDSKKKPKIEKMELDARKLQGFKTKSGLSIAKKLIPLVGDDSHPIKKLNQLMRKMLKRKIHPALEGKVQKLDGQANLPIPCESVALLRTPADTAV